MEVPNILNFLPLWLKPALTNKRTDFYVQCMDLTLFKSLIGEHLFSVKNHSQLVLGVNRLVSLPFNRNLAPINGHTN